MAIRKDVVQLSIEINGVKAGQTYQQLRNQAKDLTRELDKLEPGTEAFIKKSGELTKVNNVLATIRNTTRGVATGMDDAGKKAFSLTNILKAGAIAAIAFFSVNRILEWEKQFVGFITKGSAALEAMERKTAIVFGDAIDLVEDFAAIHASSLGVTEAKYASLAAAIGDILIPMGFQREAAAKMSVELINLSGALSEWTNGQRSSAEVSSILAKALTGERESLKEMGIVITEAEVQSRLLASGRDKLKGAALQQAKAEETLRLIMEKSQDAQRSFAINQDSIARSGNRFSAAMEQVKENLLRGFLPVIKSIGNVIADTVAPLQRQSDLVGTLQAQFNVQIETLQRGNISQENRVKLINQINEKYKEYLPNLITEKTTLSELKAIQDDVNKAFTQRILLLATEESLRDVSRDLIKAKTDELEIAQQLTAAQNEVAKFDLDKIGKGREGADQAFIQAATAAQGLTDKLRNNQEEQTRLQEKFEKTAQAARELGLDLDKILGDPASPVTPDPVETEEERNKRLKKQLDDVTGLINKERELRLDALSKLVLSEREFSARKEIINLEAENKISAAKLRIIKNTNAEEFKLKEDIVNNELKILETGKTLSLENSIAFIEQERELRLQEALVEISDEQDLANELQLIRLQAEEQILKVRLANASIVDDEYLQLQTELIAKQEEIDKRLLDTSLENTEEQINLERELAIAALDELKLLEEDYLKAREIINLEADKRILQNRLSILDANSDEAAQVRNQIGDIDRQLSKTFFNVTGASASGSSSTDESERDKELDRREQIEQAALDITQSFANARFDLLRGEVEDELALRLSVIDEVEKRKLAAAGDDAVLQKKIAAEAARDRLEAEKKAARERKKIARQEAVVQGALAIVEALPNGFAVAAAVAATIAQLAVIDAQKFFQGGYTGKRSIYRDNSGHDVAGVVHTGEWVAPKSMVQDPHTGQVIYQLEQIRRSRRGFAEGGFTSVSTTPVPVVQAVTSTGLSDEKLDRMIILLEDITMTIRQWPTVIKGKWVLSDLEKIQGEVDYIRSQANV